MRPPLAFGGEIPTEQPETTNLHPTPPPVQTIRVAPRRRCAPLAFVPSRWDECLFGKGRLFLRDGTFVSSGRNVCFFVMGRSSLREGTKSVSVDDGCGSRPVMAGVQSALQEMVRACGGRDTGSASESDAVSAGGGERSTRVGQRGRRAARRACCSVSVGST